MSIIACVIVWNEEALLPGTLAANLQSDLLTVHMLDAELLG